MGGVEIVFLDVETTIPYKKGQKFEILEFGAIVLCAQGLVEKTSFSTYVQPSSMAAISKKSVDCNGITKNDAAHAPFFSQIADHVYNLLDGLFIDSCLRSCLLACPNCVHSQLRRWQQGLWSLQSFFSV
jgi:DNA polymerase III epsilon subunit-like protein